jgi:hypothetical protein
VQVADTIAKETYTRSRTNTFLAQMNDRYFRPQGLYCLLMTYKPQSPDIVETVDINTAVARTFVQSQSGGSGANPVKSAPTTMGNVDPELNDRIKRNLKIWTGRSSGVTRGEAEMPATAELVYPDLDRANEAQKENMFKRGMEFTKDYFDRREVAKWVRRLQCRLEPLISIRKQKISIRPWGRLCRIQFFSHPGQILPTIRNTLLL